MTKTLKTAKLRPFEEYIPRESGFGAVTISGGIEAGNFVVTALDARVVLKTIDVSEDQRGAYAVVEECDTPLVGEFRLNVEVDHDTQLSVYIPAEGVSGTSTYSPRSFRVWFHSEGVKNGTGSTLNGEEHPKPSTIN